MKKEIYVHIPEPCHENWENMSPVQQGRYCKNCCKQVVDFSQMSDQQVLGILSKAAGKTCGRFSADQLERPIIRETPRLIKPYKLFLSAFIPVFLLANANKVDGQEKDKDKMRTDTLPTRMILGRIGTVVKEKQITGQVVDDKGQAIANASVIIKGTHIGVSTNRDGHFTLTNSASAKKVTLQVSYIGYTSKEVEVTQDFEKPLLIKLDESSVVTVGAVVVVRSDSSDDEWQDNDLRKTELTRLVKGSVSDENGSPMRYALIMLDMKHGIIADSDGMFTIAVPQNKKRLKISVGAGGYESVEVTYNIADRNGEIKIALTTKTTLAECGIVCLPKKDVSKIAGAISVVRPVKLADTASTFIAKVFNSEMFKAYPNPTTKGSSLTLTFKKTGNYTVQLFDNAGKLYADKAFLIQSASQAVSIALPSTITSGTYFIKAINAITKKQFIDKIIVQ